MVLNVPFGQLILTQTFELHLQAEVQKKLTQQLQQTEVVVEVGDSYSDILRGGKKKNQQMMNIFFQLIQLIKEKYDVLRKQTNKKPVKFNIPLPTGRIESLDCLYFAFSSLDLEVFPVN